MKKTSVIIIGSGNAAAFFARNISARGMEIECIISRNREKGSALAARVNSRWGSDFSALKNKECIIISAVKDSAAREVWSKCAFGKGLVLHTAGSLPLSALESFAPNCGVLYPLQTLSRARELDSAAVPLLIEANTPENLETLREFASKLSAQVTEVSSEKRAKLHLAAVFANNFSNLCFRMAWELAEKENLPCELLLPLIEETCAKLRTLSPHAAQTGPAVRWDENVIGKHLQMLEKSPETAKFYELASCEIHRRTK